MAGNNSEHKRQMVLVGVLIVSIILIVFVWYTYIRQDPNQEAITEEASDGILLAAPVQSKEAEQILNAIQVLKSVTLDTRFLDDERFKSLEITPVVIPQGVPSGIRSLGEILDMGEKKK